MACRWSRSGVSKPCNRRIYHLLVSSKLSVQVQKQTPHSSPAFLSALQIMCGTALLQQCSRAS